MTTGPDGRKVAAKGNQNMTEKEEIDELKRHLEGLRIWAEDRDQQIGDLKAAAGAILELVRDLNNTPPEQVEAFGKKYGAIWWRHRKTSIPEFDKRRLLGQDPPKGLM